MEITQSNINSNNVRYSVNIPAGCLSFKHYTWASSLVRRHLPRRPAWLVWMKKILIFSGILFIFYFVNSHYHLAVSVWRIGAEHYSVRIRNNNVLTFFLTIFILGSIFTRIMFHRYFIHVRRGFFAVSEFVLHGYYLELTYSGVQWKSNNGYAFIPWSKTKGILSDGHNDYIDLGIQGFLWIPINLPGYPRKALLDFCHQQIAASKITDK